MSGGAKVSDAGGMLGRNAGAIGTVDVSGTGSTWSNSGQVTIGGSGAGELDISSGGTVTNGPASVG